MRLDKARQILNESGYTLVEDFSIKQKYQEFDKFINAKMEELAEYFANAFPEQFEDESDAWSAIYSHLQYYFQGE